MRKYAEHQIGTVTTSSIN